MMEERCFSLNTELWQPYSESGVANVNQGTEGSKDCLTNNPNTPRLDLALTDS